MTTTTPDSEKNVVKGGMPVMPCHPTEEGGASGLLGRGAAPSTPRRRRKEKNRRSIKRFFRVTPEEDVLIDARAEDAGYEPSSFMRIQVLDKSKVRRSRRIRADLDALRRCMGVINRAGDVVNQLVRHLHRGGGFSNVADAALAELRKASHAILEALDKG
ncbi:MAG: hypothetical protein WCD70_12300 [Alphaproteobacteria bacterium]